MQTAVNHKRKDSTVRARIEPELKEHAEKIFSNLGLTTTEAIRIFFRQVELYNGLPFRLLIPSEETLEACREASEGKGLSKAYKTPEEAFKALGI